MNRLGLAVEDKAMEVPFTNHFPEYIENILMFLGKNPKINGLNTHSGKYFAVYNEVSVPEFSLSFKNAPVVKQICQFSEVH